MNKDWTTAKIVTWDCREQPDFDEISLAIVEVFNGSTCPTLHLVEDTGSDQYAVVVGERPMTHDQVVEAWHVHETEGES